VKDLRYECSTDYLRHRESILQLHRDNYGQVSREKYDSFYLGNPLGSPLLGLCFDNAKLIGQENYIRQNVASDGEMYRSAIGINTIVNSNYRLFFGVFKRLIQLTMNRMKEDTDILCAFANEESKIYYLKYFQWEVASKVQVYKKSIGYSGFSVENFLALLRPGRLRKDFKLKEIKEFNSAVLEQIVEGHKKEAEYAYFYKTPGFLNWKFLRNKHYRVIGYLLEDGGVLRGYAVAYEDGIELKIVDFLIDHDDVGIFEKFISSLGFIGAQMEKRRLVIYGTPGCWYLNSLKKHFFYHRWDFDFLTANLNRAPFDTRWVIQIGDFDIF